MICNEFLIDFIGCLIIEAITDYSNANLNLEFSRPRPLLLSEKVRFRSRLILAHSRSSCLYQLLHLTRSNRIHTKYSSINIDLLAAKTANIIKKFGVGHAKSQQLLRILDYFISKKSDWRCHCIAKNPHYCAIS